jgi:hypothetical protein
VERGLAAVFAGEVRPEPVVEPIANADPEEGRRIEVHVDAFEAVVAKPAADRFVLRNVRQAVDALVGHADVAAQIPAAAHLERRRELRHRRGREIGGESGGGHAREDARQSDRLESAHERIPFVDARHEGAAR